MWWMKGTDDGSQQQQEQVHEVDRAAIAEMKEQFEQQQQLIQQLKDLVRQNEEKLKKKDEELEGSASKLSKLNIQHKAKVAQLNKQLQERLKKNSSPSKNQSGDDDSTVEATHVDSNRGKVLMLKKQLDDSRALYEKKLKEIADSKNSAEQVLESFKAKLQERDDIIAQLKSANISDNSSKRDLPAKNEEENLGHRDVNEMYAQIVYKDSKILEMDNRILELERNVMDLQENLKEKDEVIQARNKAIQLMTEDLSRRGKAVVDQLDDTRDQMRSMQENFASAEADWKEEKRKLTEQIKESEANLKNAILEKDKSISELNASLSKLESIRFDLSTRNAELQEKVVRLQESNDTANARVIDDNGAKLESLQKEILLLNDEIHKKDILISDLQQCAGDNTKSVNQKLIKLKAQHKSQIRSLEQKIKDLQNSSNKNEELASLQNKIVDLEEEKGNLQLKLVEFDELVTLQAHNENVIQELKEKLQQQSHDLDNYVKITSTVEKQKLDLLEELAERNIVADTLRNEKQLVDVEMCVLKDKITNLEMKLLEHEKSDQEREKDQLLMSEMEDLKYEQQNQLLLTAEQEKLTLQSNVEELRENATTLTKLLEESKKESELLKEELSNKNEKLRVMEEQLKSEFHYREDASNSFVNELNKIKSDFEKEIESLKDEKDRLNLLIQEKDTSLDEFTNKIFSLTNDIKNLSTELSYRDEMDREKSSFIEKLTEEIATLKESHGVEKAKMETRISSLIDQLNDMESEVNRLQDLNKDANDKLNAHLLQTNDAMETINKAQVSLTEKESECQLLISEIKSLQVKNDELSLIIREKDNEIHQLNDSFTIKEKELKEVKGTKDAIEQNMASEHELIRKKTVELEHEISHLQDQLSTLVKESEHKDVLCLKYQSDIQNSLVVVQELEEKLQTRSAEYKDLEGTLQIVNKDKEQLQEKVTSLGEEISTCQNLIQTLNERLDGVQEELHSANFSIETLKNELEEKQNNSSKEKAEMELLLNEQRTNLMEKETELEQLVNKIKTLESEGGNQEVWAKQLEEGLIKVKSESQVLILKNEELNALVSENDSKLGMLNDEIRDLHNANEKAKYENEALTESLNLLTNEVKQTRSELESALACVEKANSNVQEYEVSLNNVNSELSDVQAELVRLRLENQGLVEERSGLETQLRLSENRADELLKEIDHVKENFSAIELELKNLKEQKMQQVMDHETVVSQLEAKIKILQSQLQEDEMKYRETIDMMRLEEIRRQNEMSDSKSTLEANFEGLVSQLSVLETERNNILQEKLVLTNKIEELQKFYDQCQIQEVELQKCFDKMEVLQSEVALITEEKNRLRDQNDRLLEYNQQLEADLTSTFEAAKTLENEKESLSLKLNGEITVLNEKCMALESDLTHEREIKHEKEIIVADLIAKFSSMQNEHQQLLETFANAEKELLTANEYVQKLNNELVAVQDKNSEILKENQDYKQLLDSKSNEIEKITEELRRISGEKQQLFNQQQVLMEKSSSMERDIEINNSLNRSLESALAEISQERQSLDKKINELREEIERLNNEMVNKNLEIEQINKYNVDINFKFQESEVQKQEACHQLQEIKEEFYSLQTSSSKLIDTTKQEVQVLQTQMSSTAQQLQILTDNNAAFEKQIVEKDLIIQNLEILTKDLQQDIILKNDKVVDLENVTLSLTQKVKILESNMNDVSHRNESTKEELQKQIELLLLDSKNQNELLQKLQTTIKEQEQDIILKGNHILDLEKASSALTQQLAALELNLGDVEQKRADFANLNENLRQQIDQLTNDMQEKDLVVQRYDAMMKDLQQAINLKNSQVSELENENVTLTQKLADLELNVNEMEQKNRELVNLNQSIAHQNDQMLKDAQEKDMIVQQYDIMIKDLQQEIHLKDSRVAELENSAIDLTQKIIDLESSVADMSQTNKEVASLNQDLRQSVEKLMEEIQNKTLLLESYSLEKETEKELLIQRYEDMIKDIQHDATLKYNRNVELENSTLVLTQNIGDLEKSKRDVEQINKDITAANLELNNRVDQLLAEINNKNEMIEAVQASNEELNLRCSSLLELQKIPQIADEVAVANLEIRDLELGPQSSEERLTQKQVISENSHTDKDNTIENLNNKISNLKKECEEKDNKIEDLSSQLLAVHNEIRKSQSELADIGDKLIAKENQMTGMSSSVENLKHSLQDSTFQLELSRKEVLNLDEKLRQSNKESEDRIELLKQEIIKLQASLHGHSERNVSLERDKQANDELEKGSQELSLIKDTFQNAFNESKIDNTKSRNAQSDRQTFETSESHIAKLNQEIERLNVKLGDFVHLQEKLEEAEKVNRKLNEEKSTWENRIDDSDIKESNTKELEKNLALQQTVDNLKHEVGALQDEKRSYQTELEECKAVIAKLNDEKVELEALVKKMESSVEKRSEKGENIVLVIDSDHHSATSELQRRDSPQVNERLLSTPSTSLQTTDASHSSPDHKQLKNKLAVLQIKNEKMLTKLKLFKDKNDKLQLQINDLMAVRAALEDDRVRMIEYNERAKNEIHRLSTELRNLERMWKTEVKMLQDRLDTVEIANSKLVEIKEHLERTLVTTTEQNELFRREKSNLERNVAKMNEEREFLNNKHKDAIDQLSQEIQQWQRQVDSLKKHNGFLESDNLEFQDLISKLQSEKAKSDQNLKAQNEKCESLTVELQKLKGGLRDLQPEDIGNVADLKKNYTALQKDYKELINIRVQLEAEIEDLRTELQEAFRDRAQLEKERDDLRATLQNKQSNSGAIEGSKDIELRELVKELSDTKIESSELCETVTLLKNELQDSKLENGLLKQTLQELSVKESQSNKMDDDRMQLESLINDLKLQNSDLIAKKSALEVEVWKLEEDKQQIAEDAQLNQQKSVNKVMADLEKFQVENQKLKEELEAQDSELRILEKEKEQIEAESRLTFQQQQETIKHLHSNVHNLQEELTTLNERNTKYEISMQNLQGELAEVQRQFEEVLLNLNAERGRALHFEAINTALQVEIEELKTKMVEHETDKADLIGEIGKLRDENASFVHKLGNLKKHLKSANEGVDMRDEVTEESLQRSTRELNKSHDHNDLNTKSREVDYLKMQITKLEAELQQVMVSLHSKDVRCEELTSEISDLIHERDSLQLRLSSVLRVDHQKEMKIKLLEEKLANQKATAADPNEFKNNASESNNLLTSDNRHLIERMRSLEENCKELHHINAVMEQALSAEREYRYKVAVDLKFANEELAALQKRPQAVQETVLSVAEDAPLLPERSQTLDATVGEWL